MSKFKVGDKIVGNEKASRRYAFTKQGWKGIVVETFPPADYDFGARGIADGDRYRLHDEFFDLIVPDEKIIITNDGKTTLARMFEGNKVVKSAQAKCAPSDTFDFATGANLAYDRLMRPNQAAKPAADKPSPEPIKMYCVKDNPPYQTKGRVYTLDCGNIEWDSYCEKSTYKDFADYARRNPNLHKTLVPLVKRPAKVGEWIIATNGGGHSKAVNTPYKVLGVASDNWVHVGPRNTGSCIRYDKYLVLDGYKGE